LHALEGEARAALHIGQACTRTASLARLSQARGLRGTLYGPTRLQLACLSVCSPAAIPCTVCLSTGENPLPERGWRGQPNSRAVCWPMLTSRRYLYTVGATHVSQQGAPRGRRDRTPRFHEPRCRACRLTGTICIRCCRLRPPPLYNYSWGTLGREHAHGEATRCVCGGGTGYVDTPPVLAMRGATHTPCPLYTGGRASDVPVVKPLPLLVGASGGCTGPVPSPREEGRDMPGAVPSAQLQVVSTAPRPTVPSHWSWVLSARVFNAGRHGTHHLRWRIAGCSRSVV
jgi:hypothetical protein